MTAEAITNISRPAHPETPTTFSRLSSRFCRFVQDAKGALRFGSTLIGGLPIPFGRFGIVLLHTVATDVHIAEVELRRGIALSGSLAISDAIEGIMNGMSGSPILAKDGQAIGVCVASGGFPGEKHTEGEPHPTLADDLPGWCLREIGISTNSPAD
jgi:hypothetical protein